MSAHRYISFSARGIFIPVVFNMALLQFVAISGAINGMNFGGVNFTGLDGYFMALCSGALGQIIALTIGYFGWLAYSHFAKE